MTAAVLAFLGLLLADEPTDTRTPVTLVTKGAPVALSEQAQFQIAKRVEALMVGCSINSVESPRVFSSRALPKEWETLRTGAHLYVHFSTPIRTTRGGVPITEVVIGLEEPSFIGPELSRHAGQVVGHVKCHGDRGLALMCATALRLHLLPGQTANCSVYDRMARPHQHGES